MIKKIVKEIVPPIFIDGYKWIRKIVSPSPLTCFYGVEGNFSSWQEALDYCAKYNHAAGYESTAILDKVANAIQEVRKGNAEFERDSFLFYEKDYNFQLLSALFLAFNGISGDKPIQVVDFGGSLGSTFFQNRSLFSTMICKVEWNVIEQRQFVDKGKKEVPEIDFFYDIDDFIGKKGKGNVLVFSAVLDYLPMPNILLDNLLNHSWDYVLIDRSFFHLDDKEIIAVQTVPPFIYDAQYPLWLRSESNQTQMMKKWGYEETLRWNSPFSMPYLKEDGFIVNVPLKGFLYKKVYDRN